jgi:hypothetical protein
MISIMPLINTIHGPMDESELIRHDGLVDNENEHTTSIEYCLKDCQGPAHSNGTPDAPGHFCNFHVHRSAHVTLKKVPSITGEIGAFA